MSNETKAAPAVPVGEPVAVIGSGWTFLWASGDAIEDIVKRHGLNIGSKLYATPAAPSQPAVPQWITADESPLMALSDCINLLASPKQLNDSVRVWACVQNAKAAMKLLAATPSAPSQPVTLTDEEIDKIADEYEDPCGRIRVDQVFPFSRAIIAALREKEQAK